MRNSILMSSPPFRQRGNFPMMARMIGMWRRTPPAGGGGGQTLSGFGLVNRGFSSGNPQTTNQKYDWAAETTATTTSSATTAQGNAASSNATVSIDGGGNTFTPTIQTVTSKYTFATDAVTAGTSYGTARRLHSANGNSTVGIHGGGVTTAGGVTTMTSTEKYTYSGDTRVSGTALGTGRYGTGNGQAGNATVGYWCGGSGSGSFVPTLTSTEKYTYSGDSRTGGTALSAIRGDHHDVSCTTFAVLAGGLDSAGNGLLTSVKYTFSGDSVGSATSLSTKRADGAGSSNFQYGMVMGGYQADGTNTTLDATEKYTFTGDTVTAGSVLAVACKFNSATSSAPGWF